MGVLAVGSSCVALGTVGCSAGGVLIPLALDSREALGFKMLAPDTSRRTCGVTWPWGSRRQHLAQEALDALFSEHPEATVVRDVGVDWRGIDLIVLQFACISVRGDVGRMVSTVSLPMLGEHGGHGESHGGH